MAPPDPGITATPYSIQFGTAGMVTHQNRWITKAGDLSIAENCTFENDMLQKEAAAAHYDVTGIAVEAPNGTFSGLTDSTFAAIWLPATSAAAFGAVMAASVASSTSPITIALSAGAAAGALVVVCIGQRINKTDFPILTALTDTQGNTYTRQKTTSGGAAVDSDVEIWTSLLTTTLTTSDTLTLTCTTGTADDRAVVVTSYTGITGATTEAVAASSFDNVAVFSSGSNTYVGRSYPALLLAVVHWPKINTTTATWAGGFAQNNAASSGALASQISLASKLVVFSTAITAQIDWKADVESSPAGTVSTTNNSNAVTGAGTSFLSDFFPGDEIIAGGETEIVDSISANNALTTVGLWVTTQAGVAYKKRSGPRVVTAALSGKLYKDRPDQGGNTGNLDFITLASGLSTTRHRAKFVPAGKESSAQLRKLFFFNGVDPVQYLSGDGTSMSTLAAYPADWNNVADAGKQPINGILHQNALFGFGNLNDPHRIYRSQSSDHTSFTGGDSGQYPIASSIGERLWGAAEYQGVLFLWKYPRGIFYFDDSDSNFLNWSYHIRSEALGCAPSPHAVLSIDEDVLFCNADGHFHLLSAVDSLGGQRTSDLTRQFGLHGWMRDHVNTSALQQMTSAWDPATKIASFGVQSTTATSTDNDLVLRWDFAQVSRGGPPRFSYSTLWKPNALTIKRRSYTDRPALLIGETATSFFIDPFNYGYRSVFGVTQGTPMHVQFAGYDLDDEEPGNRTRRKHFTHLELVFGGTDVPTVPVTAAVTVENQVRQTLSYVGANSQRILQRLKVGDGYEFQADLTLPSTSTTDVRLIGAVIWHLPGSQDQSRRR